ncbi:hypothetical protein Calab_2006 [Caldithrix abyssi DSM 13497]|uniref:Uncharacterized protein n=1 Tax=Caldithrix abyssi DSM 13497 TaxID=880073 RepID=H1XUS0_CALAY|nr:hypothetical protein [Caldithrix abyssi]APF17523.1 hypothetical protein Cabys_772 [Caldithrix abyssi DSM 13497]EHO41619.1 hypothetical protein Calab_2006 [Caldithrix abyssi DSM 13497]
MNLPVSGRVVLIDDKFKEALPLIRVLSQERIAVTFFSGRIEELPSEPFQDVRIIFMDMVLDGLDGADDKTIISTLMGVVKKIVSPESGPFILAVWTKHPEKVEKVQNALREEGFYLIQINLEKEYFFKMSEDGKEWLFDENKFDDLKKKLKEKTQEIEIFETFIIWENLIHDSASETVNEVSRFSEYNDAWNDEIKKIFYNLSKAWAGRREDDVAVKDSFYSFHQIFNDILERKTQSIETADVVFEEGELSNEVKGKINFRILADTSTYEKVYPGIVYKVHSLESSFMSDILNENDDKRLNLIIRGSIPVLIEVSPVCDFVQNKMRMSRMIKGVLLPDSVENYNSVWRKIKKSASFLYVSPVIYYGNSVFRMVLDFRYFTSEPLSNQERETIFRIRKDILNDIQTRLAFHVNRTGVLFLE